MGGAISPIAAALVMDHIIDSFNQIYPAPPTFIGIFVDDSIFILQSDMTDIALEILKNCVPNAMHFTMECEIDNQINFLNLTLRREGMAFDSQNNHYLKYIRWKYKNSLRDGRLHLPNVHLAKLLDRNINIIIFDIILHVGNYD